MKLSLDESVNSEGAEQKPSLEFNRIDVLALLWNRIKWLDVQIDKKQLKINHALRQRVYMAQVECGLCKTVLFGLKDQELDQLALEIEKIKAHIGMVQK